MKKNVLASLLLLALLVTACGAKPQDAPPEDPSAPPPAQTPGEEPAPQDPQEPIDEPGGPVLLTLEAPLDGGRTLTLEALGQESEDGRFGVREVRVLDGKDLIQTVSVREAKEAVWGVDGALVDSFYDTTDCWSREDCMEVLDLNFDGCTDFGLFGWPANNTIPFYYWLWDPAAGQYRYAFTLQGAEVHPETQELTSEYKGGQAGSQYVTDTYVPGEDGQLRLDRRKISILEEVVPNQDMERPVWVTLVPPEGQVLKPEDCGQENGGWGDRDLILFRRELPLQVLDENNRLTYYTEIWELVDGELTLTSREEFSYET